MTDLFQKILPNIVHVIELFGIIVVVYGSIKAFFYFIVNIFKRSDLSSIKLNLAECLALGLEFKLAAEILKTVIVKSFDEIIILAAVFVLRIIMTFVVDWELKHKGK